MNPNRHAGHRPNLLWIVTTQWRASACGYAGDVNARTPQLDRFAKESTDYAQAVTPHPFGPFARAAMLTGVSSPENGVQNYFDPLPVATRTIAHRLQERGYETAFFGKWHLAPREAAAALVGEAHARTIVPPDRRGGFSFWEGFEGGFLLNDPWLHGTRLEVPEKFSGYQSDVLVERAAEWLRGRGAQPWFAVVSLEAPHPPYGAPAAGVRARTADEIELPANVPRGGDVEVKARQELAGYYAHIEATDRAVGRLLQADETASDGKNGKRSCVVAFTSVHGDMHGAHGLFRKGWPHEESVRIPLLVRGANGVGRSEQAVSLVDLPGMTLAWADGNHAGSGRRSSAISMPSVVELPLQCDRVWRGVRSATRKLVLNEDGSPWLFFDLEQDPGELENLAGDPARRDEIEALRREV